ncbi:MAG: iron oxidase [Candidimonas sp.]|nr:MAG: iron oxidase [Candidimonas sp.]
MAAHAATTEQVPASGRAQKPAVQYQDHPMGTSACANCANFIPGSTPESMGHCTIVAGNISPHGWCVAYVNRN